MYFVENRWKRPQARPDADAPLRAVKKNPETESTATQCQGKAIARRAAARSTTASTLGHPKLVLWLDMSRVNARSGVPLHKNRAAGESTGRFNTRTLQASMKDWAIIRRKSEGGRAGDNSYCVCLGLLSTVRFLKNPSR
jgi:hypothetical protein